ASGPVEDVPARERSVCRATLDSWQLPLLSRRSCAVATGNVAGTCRDRPEGSAVATRRERSEARARDSLAGAALGLVPDAVGLWWRSADVLKRRRGSLRATAGQR